MVEKPTPRREIVLINKSEDSKADKWTMVERVSKMLSIAAIPIVLAIGGWYIQKQLQNQTLSRDYVQLAVSILKEPDTAKIKPELRSWAVDLLSDNSPTKFSPEIAKQLKTGETILPANLSALLKTAISEGAVAISPDGKTFLVGEVNGAASLWDLSNGNLISRLQGHSGAVTSVTFLPDGRTALTGGEDKTVRVWDLATGRMKKVLTQTDAVIGVASSPDGKIILVRVLDGTVSLWDLESGSLLRKFRLDANGT